MYGLMKARTCSYTPDQKYHRRLHYCGTCKTMGSLYGQKSRMLLDYDAVFLAEILTAISGQEQLINKWNRSYQSYNCLSLPTSGAEMPLALQVAATATVVMIDFKLADQIEDSARYRWKLAHRLFSKSFRAASSRLRQWEFPLTEMWRWFAIQNEREAEVRRSEGPRAPDATLEHLAEPTAALTGLVFQHGARVAGAPGLQREMYELGYAFGRLVYLLDAFEDFEKDARRQEFNALRAVFQISDGRLTAPHRTEAVVRIRSIEAEIEERLQQLPLSPDCTARFTSRLKENLTRKLGRRLPVVGHACKADSGAQINFSARLIAALTQSKKMTEKYRAGHPSSIFTLLQTPLVFASVLMVALVFPRQVAAAVSYRECMDVALNLMFISAALGSVMAAPFKLLPSLFSTPSSGGTPDGGWPTPPPVTPQGEPPEAPVPSQKRGCLSGCGDGCGDVDCCCCCCDDGCGDCCGSCDC